jgi:hypothetical protein
MSKFSINEEEAKAFVRLVLVAELESRADREDWELAYRIADAFGWQRPGDDISRTAWDFYWPGAWVPDADD